jgi:LPXTG-site transpeptidase (sortase) family protein
MLLLCLCLLAAAATGEALLGPSVTVPGGFVAQSPSVADIPAPVAAVPVPAPATAPVPERIADARPSRLLIPAISVDAAIEARGLEANRNLSTPTDFNDVAWFNQGPAPGQPGNALINGHVNWWTGAAVFTRLGDLRAGDQVVVVRADGSRATFKVSVIRVLSARARDASLFASSTAAKLTLVTCWGPWDFHLGTDSQRLLVTATLV